MKGKTYMGVSQSEDGSGGQVVTVVGPTGTKKLNPRFDLWNHSPTGFQWGYGGSGPAQLSLALLADALDDDERAVRLRHPFKFKVVAGWKMGEPWTITEAEIRRIADELDDTREYIVKVTQVTPDTDLDHDDLADKTKIVREHRIRATSEDGALDLFHSKIAIACLEDFDIEVRPAE